MNYEFDIEYNLDEIKYRFVIRFFLVNGPFKIFLNKVGKSDYLICRYCYFSDESQNHFLFEFCKKKILEFCSTTCLTNVGKF